MATNFPTSKQTFTDPLTTDTLNSPSHAGLHTDMNDTVEAVQDKIGTASSTPTANKILMGSGTGTSTWGIDFKDEDNQASDSATAVPSQQSVKAYVDSGTVTMTNKTLTNPVINYTDTTLTQNVKFRAYRNTDQTGVADATYTKIALNAESFDTGSDFDSSTNYRFTAPVTGYYQFNWVATVTGTTLSAVACSLYKNNAIVNIGSDFYGADGATAVSMGSAFLYLSATDYIELFLYANVASGTATIATGSEFTSLSGYLVSL